MEENLEERSKEIAIEMLGQMVKEIIIAAKKEAIEFYSRQIVALQSENKALKEKLGVRESNPILGGGSDFKLPPT